jgi:hypothetical protein
MCMGKVVVRCPNVNGLSRLLGPTGGTLFWYVDKPREAEDKVSFVEQVLECKNTEYGNKFNIFWYDK